MSCVTDGSSPGARGRATARRRRRFWLLTIVALLQVWLVACSSSPAPEVARGPVADPSRQPTQVTSDPPTVIATLSGPSSTATPSRAGGDQSALARTRAGRTFLGYYVPYDSSSWESLAAHHADLDYVAVQMATVDACGNLSSTDDQTLLRSARGWGVRVLLSLYSGSAPAVHQALASEGSMDNLVSQVTDHLRVQGYDGLDLDVEGVPAVDRPALTKLVTKLGEALHREKMTFSMAVPAKTQDATTGWAGAFDYAALGRQVDLMVVMSYAYTTASSSPGSTAPLSWVDKVARFVSDQVPREKVLLGVPLWGYDWNTTAASAARGLRYPEAAAIAQSKGKAVGLDSATQSATFTYSVAPGDVMPSLAPAPRLDHEITQRKPPACQATPPTPTVPRTTTPKPATTPTAVQQHVVWLEDARTISPRLALAGQYGLTGVAAWRLGQEDPGVWPVVEGWR